MTMKAVTLGLRYGTNAIGNIIDIVVMKAFEGVLPKQVRIYFCELIQNNISMYRRMNFSSLLV